MPVLANLLLLCAAVPMLAISFASRTGPEGPVGAHMITGPLALLQAIALGFAIQRGVFDFVPAPRLLFYVALAGYVVTMTILPILAIGRDAGAMWARAAVVAALVADFVAVNGRVPAGSMAVVLAVAGIGVGLVAAGGWAMVGTMVIAQQRNAVRRATEASERQTEFDRERSAFDKREFDKLPPDPGMWQLIQFTHSPDADVQKACLQRVHAKPRLEEETIELLGTGWAQHSLHFLRDHYPLSTGALAPAYAKFLTAERERWGKSLANDPNPGGWEVNLNVYFEVAAKIVADGGDLRAPLTQWHDFLAKTRGLGGLANRVGEILRASKR